MRPINLGDVAVVAFRPLRIDGIVCGNGIFVNLRPSDEFVVEVGVVAVQKFILCFNIL